MIIYVDREHFFSFESSKNNNSRDTTIKQGSMLIANKRKLQTKNVFF